MPEKSPTMRLESTECGKRVNRVGALQVFFFFLLRCVCFLRLFLCLFQRERKQKKLYSEDWALGDDEIEGRRSFNLQEKLENPLFATHNIVKEMHGNELNVAYFQKYGFNTPLLFKEKTGLGEWDD